MAKSKGFTLIELLVVIAIIGLLSAVVLASLNAARTKARDARRLSDMQSVVQALQLYANDNNGTYPPTPTCTGGIGNFCSLSSITSALVPKYIPTMPTDPSSGNGFDYYYCSQSSSGYALLMFKQAPPTQFWCYPQTPTPRPAACNYAFISSC